MKTIQSILTAVAGLGLAAASTQAQVNINISGAVAFRDTGYRATRALFGANLASQNPSDGPSAPTALKVTWTGTIPSLFGAQTVTVRAFYNGAVAGVQDLTQNRNVSFLATSTPGDTNIVSLQSDIAYSSVYQQSTEFQTPVLQDICPSPASRSPMRAAALSGQLRGTSPSGPGATCRAISWCVAGWEPSPLDAMPARPPGCWRSVW